MKRKIVHLEAFRGGDGDDMWAICDDGTIWKKDMVPSSEWKCVSNSPIPDAPDPQPLPDDEPAFKVGDVVKCSSTIVRVTGYEYRWVNRHGNTGTSKRCDLRHATPAEIEALEWAEKGAKR